VESFSLGIVIFLILITAQAASSSVQGDCDYAKQVNASESSAITGRSGQIERVKKSLAEKKVTLERELNLQLRLLLEMSEQSGHRSEAVSDAKVAVQKSVIFIQQILLTDKAFEQLLEAMRKHVSVSGHSLADQLEEFAGHLRGAKQIKLSQLAKAVRLLETTQEGWQADEEEIIAHYIRGYSFVEEMLKGLGRINDKLVIDTEQLDRERAGILNRIENTTKQIAAAKEAIKKDEDVIDALVNENVYSYDRISNWNPQTKCPRYSTPPQLSSIF
jgi:hypothetical protein